MRVWSLASGSEGECVHELSCNGNKFHSCVFHPAYSSLLVIGCYQASQLYQSIFLLNKPFIVFIFSGLVCKNKYFSHLLALEKPLDNVLRK